MKCTVIRLADGRELRYYDERDDAVRAAVDRRDLAGPPPASQLRYDPLTDEWVTIAGHRQGRTFLPAPDECPLCPSTADRSTEVPADDYDVVVFENRFPALGGRSGPAGGDPLATPYSPVRPGTGRCEVVCFTAEHDASFADLSPDRVRTVLDVLADRTVELSAMPGVEQVFCFENRGVEIGVTLHHPHGQIYALPFVTPRTRTLLGAARRHHAATGRHLLADVLAAERAAGVRVVAANAHWTAYVPAAARWPVEVQLTPHRRVPDIPALDDAERAAFGPLYLDLLRRLDGLFGVPMPYVSAWHQAPVRVDRELAHLYLQLFSVRRAPGRLKYLAGTESAMGMFVNDVLPEEAARLLRAAEPRTRGVVGGRG